MSLTKQRPMNIVGRVLLLEQMRKIDPIEIQKIAPEFTFQYDEINDDGEDKTIVEINWEFALFDATMYQLQKLFNKFVAKKEVKSKGNQVAVKKEIKDGKVKTSIEIERLNKVIENEVAEQSIN